MYIYITYFFKYVFSKYNLANLSHFFSKSLESCRMGNQKHLPITLCCVISKV